MDTYEYEFVLSKFCTSTRKWACVPLQKWKNVFKHLCLYPYFHDQILPYTLVFDLRRTAPVKFGRGTPVLVSLDIYYPFKFALYTYFVNSMLFWIAKPMEHAHPQFQIYFLLIKTSLTFVFRIKINTFTVHFTELL